MTMQLRQLIPLGAILLALGTRCATAHEIQFQLTNWWNRFAAHGALVVEAPLIAAEAPPAAAEAAQGEPQVDAAEAQDAAPNAPADEIPDDQAQALQLQLKPHLDSMLKLELAFLQQACQLDRAKMLEVQNGADKTLAEILGNMVKMQRQVLRAAGMGFRQPANTPSDPRQLIRDKLLEIVKPLVDDKGIEKYRSELAARDQFQRQAGVKSLVAILDGRLLLNSEQRNNLVAAIEKSWDPSWQGNLEILIHNPQFFPMIPDEVILPHLTPGQQDAWRTMEKSGVAFGANQWMFAVNGDVMVVDGEVEDVVEEVLEIVEDELQATADEEDTEKDVPKQVETGDRAAD